MAWLSILFFGVCTCLLISCVLFVHLHGFVCWFPPVVCPSEIDSASRVARSARPRVSVFVMLSRECLLPDTRAYLYLCRCNDWARVLAVRRQIQESESIRLHCSFGPKAFKASWIVGELLIIKVARRKYDLYRSFLSRLYSVYLLT